MSANFDLIEHGTYTVAGPPPYSISFSAPFARLPSLCITPQATSATGAGSNPNINVWITQITTTGAEFSLSGYEHTSMHGIIFNWRAVLSNIM